MIEFPFPLMKYELVRELSFIDCVLPIPCLYPYAVAEMSHSTLTEYSLQVVDDKMRFNKVRVLNIPGNFN